MLTSSKGEHRHLGEPEIPRHPLRFEQVRIENTAHCGYRCFFCPREKLTRERGFMSMDDLDLVLDRVGEHRGRVDLHGFGEPLLDPNLPSKVALVAQRWPAAATTIYSTLGVHVDSTWLGALVEAGLACIEVSFYGTDARSYKLAHGVNRFDLARTNLITLTKLRDELGSSLRIVARAFPSHPSVQEPGTSDDSRAAFDYWMDSLGIDFRRERCLHNYGTGRVYNARGIGTCSIIWGFRYRVLQITWDLHVIPCCFDSNADIRLGNLREQTLAEIFAGPTYGAFYKAHSLNDLEDLPVCMACERCHLP